MNLFTQKKSLLLYFLILGLITGCNNSLNNGKKLDLNVNIIEVNAWQNLMPGKEPSFHLSGKIKIINNEESSLINLILRGIIISQGSESVLQSHVFFNTLSGDNDILPNSEKVFNFKTSMNMEKINRININKVISLKLLFTSGGKNYNFKVDNIKIEKVY